MSPPAIIYFLWFISDNGSVVKNDLIDSSSSERMEENNGNYLINYFLRFSVFNFVFIYFCNFKTENAS